MNINQVKTDVKAVCSHANGDTLDETLLNTLQKCNISDKYIQAIRKEMQHHSQTIVDYVIARSFFCEELDTLVLDLEVRYHDGLKSYKRFKYGQYSYDELGGINIYMLQSTKCHHTGVIHVDGLGYICNVISDAAGTSTTFLFKDGKIIDTSTLGKNIN